VRSGTDTQCQVDLLTCNLSQPQSEEAVASGFAVETTGPSRARAAHKEKLLGDRTSNDAATNNAKSSAAASEARSSESNLGCSVVLNLFRIEACG